MELKAEDITIAVTVFSRRDFVLEAIGSALAQSVPVSVIVVEDCGPDPGMRDYIQDRFGGRIRYFRNPRNRGLFDNWNACMEYSRTPWLSILHDDDRLHPWFIEEMIALHEFDAGTDQNAFVVRTKRGFFIINFSQKIADGRTFRQLYIHFRGSCQVAQLRIELHA